MIGDRDQFTGEFAGIVLGGGRSSRFGRDKLAEPFGGEPLLWRPIRAVASVCREVVLVLAPEMPIPDLPPDVASIVRVARDPEPFGGPLVGMAAGLAVATGRWVVVVAGDQPGLRPELLGFLAQTIAASRRASNPGVAGDSPGGHVRDSSRAALPDSPRAAALPDSGAALPDSARAAALCDEAGVTRPLPCALDREAALAQAGSLLASGERRLRALLAALNVAAIPEEAWRPFDPAAGWTRDIDVPNDVLPADQFG